MADAKEKNGTKPKKERRPARTIEERIAELQQRAEAKQNKERTKAAASLQKLNDRVVKLESQLAEAYIARDAALAVLGDDATPEPEDAGDEAEAADSADDVASV